jgi:hypothetical protein
MSVRDMLKCIAVVSANDCAVAMAEHLGGTEENFVKLMNRRAKELGMKNTHFSNCSGLFDDDAHFTTAYDVALMSRELIKHELIKDYTVRLLLNGEVVKEIPVKDNYQRLNVLDLENTPCDSAEILVHSTNGHENAVIFEVRAY